MRKFFYIKAAFFAAACTVPLSGIDQEYEEKNRPSVTEPFKNNRYSLPRSAQEEVFHSIRVGKHEVYAMPSTVRNLGNVLYEISALSGKDIAIVEPSNPYNLESFLKFSGFFRLMQVPEQKRNKLNIMLSQTAANFEAMYGANYSAQRVDPGHNKACIITGEMKPSLMHLASQIGHIPQSLKTQKFEQNFEDKKSMLLFVLFHEASHCRSHGNKDDFFASEINADRVGVQRYKQLIEKGWKLDSALPKKVRSLRLLAPLFSTSTDAQNVMSGFMEIHSSAGGFSDDKRKARDLLGEASLFKLAVKSRIYDAIPLEKKREFHKLADQQTDEFLAEQKMQLNALLRQHGRDGAMARVVLKILPSMRGIVSKQIVSNMAQKADQSIIQDAMLSLVQEDAEIIFSPKVKINAAQIARASLQAWDMLALKSTISAQNRTYSATDELLDDFKILSRMMADALKKENSAKINKINTMARGF